MELRLAKDLFDQISNIFRAMGASEGAAALIADVLVRAELRSIPSHGVMRVKDYYDLWKAGRLNITPKPEVVHETLTTAVVDGDNGMGMIPGVMAMELAIEKAKHAGTGWVAVRNSNHYGIAAYYSMMALEHDMIGISMTNANPLVAPTFSVSRLLGTNPLAVAIPAGEEPPFVADFASTPIARGKLAMMEKKGEDAPHGFVQDASGLPSTDPAIITRGGAIVPLGSDREHGSHKGYCLGAIIDILSAVLPGANFGPFVPPQVSYLQPRPDAPGKGLGHFFGAMRIDAFQQPEDFKRMMDLWIRTFRDATPATGQERVYIPGDIERESEERLMREGVLLNEKVMQDLQWVAGELMC
ncbi:MAG TPA: Ldh family oxidoreductase [Bacteroidales bacterium]|nr:Ldh family oxidoreductase [Bacteroidales bacterium]HRZ48963.1 Ldh family oxidoreductase [Bacteroidales bacterium]